MCNKQAATLLCKILAWLVKVNIVFKWYVKFETFPSEDEQVSFFQYFPDNLTTFGSIPADNVKRTSENFIK